jgi:hypothetical protein
MYGIIKYIKVCAMGVPEGKVEKREKKILKWQKHSISDDEIQC